MNIRNRFKAILYFFRNWIAIRDPSIRNQEPEPLVVMENNLLSGKNVLITAAGRNIGRSIAIEMAKQGANIFFTDIHEERCTKLEQELHSV